MRHPLRSLLLLATLLCATGAWADGCRVERDSIGQRYTIVRSGGAYAGLAARWSWYSGNFLGIATISDSTHALRDKNCLAAFLRTEGITDTAGSLPYELSWVLESNGRNRSPSRWMDGYDSTFGSYCAFLPTIDRPMRSALLRYTTEAILPDFDEAVVCFGRTNNGLGSALPVDRPGVELVRTAHGLILRRGDRYKWLYLSDHQTKLRWPTLGRESVQVRGNEISLRAVDPTCDNGFQGAPDPDCVTSRTWRLDRLLSDP